MTPQPLEALDPLLETACVLIETLNGQWVVCIRPYDGGFPLVKGASVHLSEAVQEAVERWQAA